jgi:hypothetical protein
MKYTELFTAHRIAGLVDWFAERPELCVEIYYPHSGGGPGYFTVRSLAELKTLIQGIDCLEIQITIWKSHSQFELESDQAESFLTKLEWICQHSDEVMYFSVQRIEAGTSPTQMVRKNTENTFKGGRSECSPLLFVCL